MPEPWQRVRPILESALELDPTQRTDFLDKAEACADPSVRQVVEALIAAYEQAGTNVLGTAAAVRFVSEEELRFRLLPGKHVGAYEILEEIAQGGMGAVYRAVRADGQYQQQVALKIVRAELGGELTAARFRAERQILASLDHPNIARILDAGTTTEGLPYFVMEFIDGQPISEHCDRHRLSIDARLKLFRTVCSAVHNAHQHLVVHRDIKPGNILVTSDGVPKLLDFGIAKIFDPSLLPENATLTAAGLWLMTPEYASPEQLRGEAITTATDVYSLGLVLYELLTGRCAYEFASHLPHDVARAVLETEPKKPSDAIRRQGTSEDQQREKASPPRELAGSMGDSPEKLRRRLAGDLDNIVLKAIRKEPRERYSSADQLSEDIRRHLDGLPIQARKATLTYRSRKYVLRHKVGVAAATLVFLSLLTGIALTQREARIARASELRAERRLQQIQHLTDSLFNELPIYIDGSPTQAKELLNRKAIEYIQQANLYGSTDPRLADDLALGYLRLGEALGQPGVSNLGNPSAAIDNYGRAIILFENRLAADPNNLHLRMLLAHTYLASGLALLGTNVSKAVGLYGKALGTFPDDIEASTTFPDSERREAATERLWGYEILGEQYGDPYFANLGDTTRALEYLNKALALANQRKRPDFSRADLYDFYYIHTQMAGVLWARGDLRRALDYQRRGEALFDALISPATIGPFDSGWRPAPNSQSLRDQQAMMMIRRANLLMASGRNEQAKTALVKSREILERMFWVDPLNAGVRRDLTRNYNLSGDLLLRIGDSSRALKNYARALQMSTEFLAQQPDQPEVRHRLADSYEGTGNALAAMGRTSDSLENCRKALAIRESLARLDPNDARYKFSLAKNYVSQAAIMAKAHDRVGAIANYRRAVAIQKSLAANDPFNSLVAQDLAKTQRNLHALNATAGTAAGLLPAPSGCGK